MLATDMTWLASRYQHTKTGGASRFYVRRLNTDGSVSSSDVDLYGVYSDGDKDTCKVSRKIRPVVSLKSTIRITSGDGTQANPYIIN